MARRGRAASPILGTASALIGAASAVLVSRDSRFRHSFEAALDSVEPDPAQARKRFDEAEIRALAGTMAEQGQLQPILVRPDPAARGRWIIVAGERRWRAARLNGWPAILAIEHDQDPEVAALIENLQRVDLAPVEEARGLERLIRTKGWSQNDAAAALGKSKAEVSATLRILSLPEDVLDAVSTSEPPLPKNALIELARVERPALRERLLARARAGTLTVRAIRDAVAAEARAGEGAPEGGAGEAAGRPPRPVGPAMLARLAERLQAARAAGRPVGRAERERLLRLKDAIERRLAEG